jgi:hypothetical protein
MITKSSSIKQKRKEEKGYFAKLMNQCNPGYLAKPANRVMNFTKFKEFDFSSESLFYLIIC